MLLSEIKLIGESKEQDEEQFKRDTAPKSLGAGAPLGKLKRGSLWRRATGSTILKRYHLKLCDEYGVPKQKIVLQRLL